MRLVRGANSRPQQGEQRIATATDTTDYRVNERIRAREVRLIDAEGQQLGVKALPEALAVARQLDLDLVEVAPDANPPVCRIMDYNRFKYETAQRAKESRKKATNTSIKEMKYRPKIGTGDFTTKTRQVGRFLEEGHKVKVTIMFRGREVSHPELGMKILEDLAEQVSAVSKVEAAPKLDGRNMVMVLAPDRRAKAARKPAPARPTTASAPPASDQASAASSAEASVPAPAAAGSPASDAPTTVTPTTVTPTTVTPTTVTPTTVTPTTVTPTTAPEGAPVPVAASAPAPVAPAPAPVPVAAAPPVPVAASTSEVVEDRVPPAGPANGARRSDGHSTRARPAVTAVAAAPGDGAASTSS
jgi:translation initiation factor IF-3